MAERTGRERMRDERILFDVDEGLCEEPRLLSDPRLLGALHADLVARRGPDEARVALVQLGFLHGLRDAIRGAARLSAQVRPGPHPPVTTALLPLALEARPRGTPRGEVAIAGRWPGAVEAAAHLLRVGREREAACGHSSGYTAGFYSGLLERDLVAVERSCVARGDVACRFEVRDAAAWKERGDADALVLVEALPFEAFRALAARSTESIARPRASAPPIAAEEGPVVHVWGPVMVMPFRDPDQALRGLALIGSDPAAREVSVVVIDLGGEPLDDAFEASNLESVVDAIAGWGAEAVLANVSPLGEDAVADLVARGVAARKDLPLAIACAFQIAGAQRQTV
jgi:hypothetical protein